MAHWIALGPCESPAQLESAGWWALTYTPRVAVQAPVVLLDVQASLRLFGGPQRLCARLASEARARGLDGGATAGSAGGARARLLARTGWADDWHEGWSRSLPELLDPLPLHVLPECARHHATLAPLGCRTLGDVRRLPRSGLARRFGAVLLRELDQAYGQHPETFDWLLLPEHFERRLELPARIEQADALLDGGRVLLQALCDWLDDRHAGVRALTLGWTLDASRHLDTSGAHLELRLADASRDLERLTRLLGEHLRRTTLPAPVDGLVLRARDLVTLVAQADDLFADQPAGPADIAWAGGVAAQRRQRGQWHALLERLAARLGAQRVRQGQWRADHRPEQAQVWQPWDADAVAAVHREPPTPPAQLAPQPTWLLDPPRPLAVQRARPPAPEQPIYLGPLRLLSGPHRIEAGWWDPVSPAVSRDYYIAHGERAGLVWIFHVGRWQHEGIGSPWFLHGLFA